MVFKKPYAFLIKHFRIIHLAMLACYIFFWLTLNDINNLFSMLYKTDTLIYAGANVYINKFIFVLFLIVLILSGIIYWLFKIKKKPRRFYLFLIIYTIALIPFYIYFFSVLARLVDNVVEIDTIAFCRDISFVTIMPSYIVIVILFVRGIGFNIKQFNFSKDLKELEIDESDSEEIEVMVGKNNYKYMRYLRRSIREAKYYILENKFAILFITSLFVIVGVFFGIRYYFSYMKTLSQEEATSVNGIAYTVRKSYVTNYDTVGNEISEDYKYVVINMSFHNSTLISKPIDLDLITLNNGGLYYHPTLTKNELFYDLGVPYIKGHKLAPKETIDATLTFEIPKSASTSNLKLKVRYGIENKVDSVVSRYRTFDVNPIKIDKDMKEYNYQINDVININPVGKNKFDLKITDYKLQDTYENRYVVCDMNNKCLQLSNVIKPEQKDLNTMLVVSYESILYEDNDFIKSLNTYNKIFENYLTVNYTIMGRYYSVPASIVTKSDIDNKIFIIMDRKITRADTIDLEFNFRNDKYVIPLLT